MVEFPKMRVDSRVCTMYNANTMAGTISRAESPKCVICKSTRDLATLCPDDGPSFNLCVGCLNRAYKVATEGGGFKIDQPIGKHERYLQPELTEGLGLPPVSEVKAANVTGGLMTSEQVAHVIGMSVFSVYARATDGRLEKVKYGIKKYNITRNSVVRYLADELGDTIKAVDKLREIEATEEYKAIRSPKHGHGE